MKLQEETLSTERVFTGSFLKVERDQVKAPNGKVYSREYIVHPGAALVIPLLENGNVVMLKQYRHALGQVFLEFPAGKIDKGEDTIVTARRELQEEAGYQAGTLKYLTRIHPVIGYSNELIDIYLATDLKLVGQNLDEGEFVELVELSVDELMQKVFVGAVSDVKTQIAAFWLEKIVKKAWTP